MPTIQSIPYPSYTTAQRDALTSVPEGFKIKNTTTGKIQMYSTGGVWVDIGGIFRFRGIFNQSGTNAPTYTELENNFGVSPTLSYQTDGMFQITFTGIDFTAGTLVVNKQNEVKHGTGLYGRAIFIFDDGDGFNGILNIETTKIIYGSTTSLENSLMSNEDIIIELHI